MHIETERLLLRPFCESDASDALEYLRNPVPNCFACMKLDNLEEAKTEMRNRSVDLELSFAIVLKETGKVIGEIEAFPEAFSQCVHVRVPESKTEEIQSHSLSDNVPDVRQRSYFMGREENDVPCGQISSFPELPCLSSD